MVELVFAQITSMFQENVKSVLNSYNVRFVIVLAYNTVVWHWCNSQESYKQFVANRINQTS